MSEENQNKEMEDPKQHVEARRANKVSPWAWYVVKENGQAYGPYHTQEDAQKAIDEHRIS